MRGLIKSSRRLTSIMDSNKYIPLDRYSFFERLLDYIKRFDSNWENVIKGASNEKIDKYLHLATQNNKQLVIPQEYIIYLKKWEKTMAVYWKIS